MANLLNGVLNKALGATTNAVRDITGINPSESLGKQLENFASQALTADNVRDPQHGARLFNDNNFELIPKQSGLFHIFIEFVDPNQFESTRKIELNMLAKSVSLPAFNFDTQTLNSYNRKIVVQKKVTYDPVTIVFHDDSANVVHQFYRNYFQHYYRDGDHAFPLYDNQSVYGLRTTDAWGFNPLTNITGTSDLPARQGNFLRAIRIYSLQSKKATEYILINPMITRWRNGSHQAGSNEFIDSEMTITYEAVKYNPNVRTNFITPETVKGFGDQHYDRTPSPLKTLGSTTSIFGPAGALESLEGIAGGIASGTGTGLINAALTSARTFNTFKNANLREVAVSNLRDGFRDIARDGAQATSQSGRYRFPSSPNILRGQGTNRG